jgi:hypothetical protein
MRDLGLGWCWWIVECSAWRVEALVRVNDPRGCGLCLMLGGSRRTCAHGCRRVSIAVKEVMDLEIHRTNGEGRHVYKYEKTNV